MQVLNRCLISLAIHFDTVALAFSMVYLLVQYIFQHFNNNCIYTRNNIIMISEWWVSYQLWYLHFSYPFSGRTFGLLCRYRSNSFANNNRCGYNYFHKLPITLAVVYLNVTINNMMWQTCQKTLFCIRPMSVIHFPEPLQVWACIFSYFVRYKNMVCHYICMLVNWKLCNTGAFLLC